MALQDISQDNLHDGLSGGKVFNRKKVIIKKQNKSKSVNKFKGFEAMNENLGPDTATDVLSDRQDGNINITRALKAEESDDEGTQNEAKIKSNASSNKVTHRKVVTRKVVKKKHGSEQAANDGGTLSGIVTPTGTTTKVIDL